MAGPQPRSREYKIPTVRDVASLGELHQNEIDLLWLIRTRYRFGRIEIECRDGLPQDILRTVERNRITEAVLER